MHFLVIGIVFFVAFIVTVNYGVGRAFGVVYMPALLLLSRVLPVENPHVMNIDGVSAAVYGILLGLPLAKERLQLRFNALDAIVILLSIIAIVSGVSNGEFYTAINAGFAEFLDRLAPYFLARLAFRDLENRKAALKWLLVVSYIIFFFALVEVRLQPYFFHHVLYKLKMSVPLQQMAYKRFDFFRVAGPMDHPIYFGNACLVLLGMMIVLAKTTGRKLTEKPIALGLAAISASLFFSLSFTPFIGTFAGLAVFVLLRFVPSGRLLLVPGLLVFILTVLSYTYTVAQRPPPKTEGATELEQSWETRQLIIRGAWRIAANAPMLGWGKQFEWEDIVLKSVDNSYLVFAMTYGQTYMWIWMSISILVCLRAIPALGILKNKDGIFTLSVAVGTVLGIMVAMYTVWAGGVYTIVWLCMLGCTNTLIDLMRSPATVAQPARSNLPQGRLGYSRG